MANTCEKKQNLWPRMALAAIFGFFCFDIAIYGQTLIGEINQPTVYVIPARAARDFRPQAVQPSEVPTSEPMPAPAPPIERPLNILILGRSGGDWTAPDLTDTIMILHLSPENKAVLISIPRDLWVKVPDRSYYSKINALFVLGNGPKTEQSGIELVKRKITETTGLIPDYYLLTDIAALKDLVDELGGIDVYVEKMIDDQVYQYLTLEKGWHHLDGAAVQKYVRTRQDSGGDFARIQRQQQIISILKDKIMALNWVLDLPKIMGIFQIIGRNVSTDMGISEKEHFLNIARLFKGQEIQHLVVGVAENLLVSSSVLTNNGIASILVPRAGTDNYQEIKEYIANNL